MVASTLGNGRNYHVSHWSRGPWGDQTGPGVWEGLRPVRTTEGNRDGSTPLVSWKVVDWGKRVTTTRVWGWSHSWGLPSLKNVT